ncbi:MAG: DUF192 domain-containing protein [Pseudomonadota bacterium]
MKGLLGRPAGYAAGGVILLGAAAAVPSLAAPACAPERATAVRIGAREWRVETAATPAQRERGLSGRPGLPAGRGMWFVLSEPGIHGFWMRDMRFAIDLAWITPQGRVAGVETLPPCTAAPCPIHYAPEPVAYVLEAAAGTLPRDEDGQASWDCAPD